MEAFFATIILLAIVFVFTNEFFQQKLGVAPMPTMPKVKKAMIVEIPADTKDTILELGSGWGGVSILAGKKFPDCEVIGVEYSIFPYICSVIRGYFLNNVKFTR